MKGLKKNLIFWAVTYEKVVGAMFLGIFVYVFMMAFVGGGISPEELRSRFLGYIWLFIGISAFVNGFSGSLSYFPQTISLGSTRRASFTGMQIMQHVIMLQYLVIGIVAYFFLDQEMLVKLLQMGLSIIGGVLLLIALSNLVCICSVKFGRTVGMVVYIVTFISVLVGVCVVLFINSGNKEDIFHAISEICSKPYLFLGGILADAVTMALYYRMSLKQDLQF